MNLSPQIVYQIEEISFGFLSMCEPVLYFSPLLVFFHQQVLICPFILPLNITDNIEYYKLVWTCQKIKINTQIYLFRTSFLPGPFYLYYSILMNMLSAPDFHPERKKPLPCKTLVSPSCFADTKFIGCFVHVHSQPKMTWGGYESHMENNRRMDVFLSCKLFELCLMLKKGC